MKKTVLCILISVLCFLPSAFPAESGVEAKVIPAGNLPVSVRPGLFGDSGVALTNVATVTDLAGKLDASAATAQAYGSVYIHDGTNTINLTPTNYTPIQMWATNSPQSKAPPLNCVALTNGIRVLVSGVYNVSYNISMTGQNNSIVEAGLFVDEVHQDSTEFNRKISTGADVGSASAGGQLYLTSNQVVSVRRITDTAGAYTVVQGQLIVTKIGLTVQNLPIVTTVAEGNTNNVIAGDAVKNALDSKVNQGNLIATSNTLDAIHIGIFGQSKAVFTYGGNAGLTGEQATGITNTFMVDQTETLGTFYVQTNISCVTTSRWSIELKMAQSLRDRTGKQIYVSKGARSGTTITNFMTGGPYNFTITNALNRMSTIFTNAGKLTAVCWLQGETDAGYTTSSVAYASNLRTMIAQIRALPSVSYNTPIFINDIQPVQGTMAYISLVTKAFYDVAKEDPYVIVVTNGDIAVSADTVHFDEAGQLLLGQRFADYIYNYLSNNATMSQGAVKGEKITAKTLVTDSLIMSDGSSLADCIIPISEQGLWLYAPLRGSLADVSTNGHTNVVFGTQTWPSDSLGQYFLSTNETTYGRIYNFPAITNSDYTVSFAVKRNWGVASGSLNYMMQISSGLIIAITSGTSTNPYTASTPKVTFKDASGTAFAYDVGAQIGTNEFERFAMTVDRNSTNSVIRFYYNGRPATRALPTNDLSVTSGTATTDLTLGNTATNTFLNGGLRDVVVYGRVLSEDEVRRLHANQEQNRSGIRGIN